MNLFQFYKRHDPASAEEHELMENLFDILCASLVEKQNREKFLKGEGLQLMNLMLRYVHLEGYIWKVLFIIIHF